MAQPPTGNPAFFGQRVSKPGVNVTKAGPTDLVYQNDYTTTTYYDNSNSRILIGQLPNGSYGMEVSLPGHDVTTASAQQLAFSSSFASLVSVFSQSGTEVIAAGQTVVLGPFSTGTGVQTIPLITCIFNPGLFNQNFGSYTGTVPPNTLAAVAPSVFFNSIDNFSIYFPVDLVDLDTYDYTINMMLLTNQ
jgi:hypothetical protein